MTFHYNHYLAGGWTNPFEKYARQNGFIFPNFRGEHITYLSCHHPVILIGLEGSLYSLFSIIPISLGRMSSPISNNQPRFRTPLKLHCQQLLDAKNLWWFGNGPIFLSTMRVLGCRAICFWECIDSYTWTRMLHLSLTYPPYMKMYIFPS